MADLDGDAVEHGGGSDKATGVYISTVDTMAFVRL